MAVLNAKGSFDLQKIAALAGMLSPLAFLVAVVVTASLRPEYSHSGQFISELGETGGAGAWIMNVFGFGAFGVLSAVFFASRYVAVANSRFPTAGRIAVALSLLFSLGILGAGVFSCDPSCMPDNPTRNQILHNAASVVLLLFIVTIPVWVYHLEWLSRAPRLWWYTRLTTIVAALSFVLMLGAQEDRANLVTYQRVLVGSMWLWIAVFAWRVYRGEAIDQA